MGEMSRRWPFQTPPFELVIREPALVGDALGLKTWGSSYLLAQMLPQLKEQYFSHLLAAGYRQRVAVLELGSGTGLLGLAAAASWRVDVLLSDLPDIMPNLTFNAEQNAETVRGLEGSASTAVYEWGGTEETIDPRFGERHTYPVRT
jgi:hypothetical protein